MLILEQAKGGSIMTQMNSESNMTPGSIEDLKAFVTQFEFILPEEKRQIIRDIIEQIEVSGGIQDETQGQAILNNLIKGLGL